jgi:hypothetical protein
MRRLTSPIRETAVNCSNTVVQEVIARRTGRSTGAFPPGLVLLRDLHLHPLEVALVIVDVEDIVGVRVGLAEIGLIRTVGDLVSCVSREMARTYGANHEGAAAPYFEREGDEPRVAQPAARRK